MATKWQRTYVDEVSGDECPNRSQLFLSLGDRPQGMTMDEALAVDPTQPRKPSFWYFMHRLAPNHNREARRGFGPDGIERVFFTPRAPDR